MEKLHLEGAADWAEAAKAAGENVQRMGVRAEAHAEAEEEAVATPIT